MLKFTYSCTYTPRRKRWPYTATWSSWEVCSSIVRIFYVPSTHGSFCIHPDSSSTNFTFRVSYTVNTPSTYQKLAQFPSSTSGHQPQLRCGRHHRRRLQRATSSCLCSSSSLQIMQKPGHQTGRENVFSPGKIRLQLPRGVLGKTARNGKNLWQSIQFAYSIFHCSAWKRRQLPTGRCGMPLMRFAVRPTSFLLQRTRLVSCYMYLLCICHSTVLFVYSLLLLCLCTLYSLVNIQVQSMWNWATSSILEIVGTLPLCDYD